MESDHESRPLGEPPRAEDQGLGEPAAPGVSGPPLGIPVAQPVIGAAGRVAPGGIDLLIGVACAWWMEIALGGGLALVVLLREGNSGTFDLGMLPPLGILATALTSAVFAGLVSWYFVCHRYRRSLAEGLAIKKVGPLTVAACVGLAVAGAILPMLGSSSGGTGRSPMAQLVSTREGLAVICALALILPPLEEVYYRGFIFPILRRYLGAPWAIVLVTLWFGGAHFPQLMGDWPTLVIVTGMGALWTILRHVTGSLVPSIMTHWIYNLLVVLPAIFWD